jgi:peptidoglycan hydrolase CwlO-like protein
MPSFVKKNKFIMAFGFVLVILGISLSSIGLGSSALESSIIHVNPGQTPEMTLRTMNEEVRDLEHQVDGLTSSIALKENDLSVRDARIAEKEAQVSEIEKFIGESCGQPTGTYIDLCEKKNTRVEKTKKEITKLRELETEIASMKNDMNTLITKLAEKKGNLYIFQAK